MEDRGAKPCEFSQTAPPHKPSDSVLNATFPGSLRNLQTVSFLKLLDLPYVLDNASDSRDTPASWPQKGLEGGLRLYAASWVRDIGPDLRPNDYKKDDGTEGKSNGDKRRSTDTEPSTLEDIAIAARGGMETLGPALERLYMTRASAYRDALKSFMEGYEEGIQQVMEKKEDSSLAQQEVILIKIQLDG